MFFQSSDEGTWCKDGQSAAPSAYNRWPLWGVPQNYQNDSWLHCHRGARDQCSWGCGEVLLYIQVCMFLTLSTLLKIDSNRLFCLFFRSFLRSFLRPSVRPTVNNFFCSGFFNRQFACFVCLRLQTFYVLLFSISNREHSALSAAAAAGDKLTPLDVWQPQTSARLGVSHASPDVVDVVESDPPCLSRSVLDFTIISNFVSALKFCFRRL